MCVGSGQTNSHVFLREKKCLGHNPPPLIHGFGVTLACTSFPVPVDTIFVVLSCHKQRIKLAILVSDFEKP